MYKKRKPNAELALPLGSANLPVMAELSDWNIETNKALAEIGGIRGSDRRHYAA